MKVIVTIEIKVHDQTLEDIKETLECDLPESNDFEYKILDVKQV